MKKAWLILGITAAVVLSADFAYLQWRERSIEPLTSPVDLTRPGSYTWEAGGFHSSPYHPEFRLTLPFPAPEDWDWGEDFERIWGGTPPEIAIEVQDSDGRRLLYERSQVTPAEDWIVTGGFGDTTVEVYKLTELTPALFSSCRVTLQVLRGSPSAVPSRVEFNIAAIRAYALLPASLGFFALCVLFGLAALVLGIVHLVAYRRGRQRALPGGALGA